MSTHAWIILGLGAAWLAYYIWDEYIRPAPGDGEGGFRDFLKHPERSRGIDLSRCPGNAWALPDSDDVAAWDTCVRKAVGQRWDTFEYGRLVDRSPRIPEAALRLLGDSEFLDKPWPKGKSLLSYWNLSAVERLLPDVLPASALSHLDPLLGHPDEDYRKMAAGILAHVDHAEAAGRMASILHGDDDDMRNGLTYGMAQAAYQRDGDADLIRALWDDLFATLDAERMYYDGLAVIVRRMITADPERARRLAAPTFLRWDRRHLDCLLHGLRLGGLSPERSHLGSLIATWQETAPSETWSAYHRARVVEEALAHLVRMPPVDEQVSALVERLLSDADPEMRGHAAPAYLSLHGITTDPRTTCHHVVFEIKGMLTQAQTDYWEVVQLLDEVMNGGWHQYFANSSGDGWKRCLDACGRMGLAAVADEMRCAAAVFGPAGPDTNRLRRRQQLAALTRHQDGIIEQLRLDDNAVAVALARYAVAHRDDFT